MRKAVLCVLATLLICVTACGTAEGDIARIFAYEEGVARYANAEGKIGLVGEAGEILVPAIYDVIGMFDENGLAITYRDADGTPHYGLLDRSGRVIADDRDYSYIGAGYAGRLMDCYTNRFGVYEARGQDDQQYNIFADGTVARFPDRETLNNTRFQHTLNTNAFFIEGSILLRTGEGWRLFGMDGNPLTDDVWEDCEAFPIGGGAVKKDGLRGMIDSRGNLTVDYQFELVPSYTDSGALVCVRDEEDRWRHGMISPVTGEIIVPLIYDDISAMSDHRMLVAVDGLYGYLNESYEWAIPPQWERAYDFSEHVAWVSDGSGWCWQMIDENGQVILDDQNFPDGAVFYSPNYIAVCHETEVITVHDHSGQTVLTLANALYGGENARVSDGLLPITFVKEEHGDGFLNLETGDLLTPLLWDETSNFEDGYAIVVMDDLYGVIDREGNYVIEPIYASMDRIDTIDKVYFEAFGPETDFYGGGIFDYYVLNEAGEVMSITKEALIG